MRKFFARLKKNLKGCNCLQPIILAQACIRKTAAAAMTAVMKYAVGVKTPDGNWHLKCADTGHKKIEELDDEDDEKIDIVNELSAFTRRSGEYVTAIHVVHNPFHLIRLLWSPVRAREMCARK